MIGTVNARGMIAVQKTGFAQALLNIKNEELADKLTRTVERIRAEIETQLRAATPDPQQIFANQRQTTGRLITEQRDAVRDADDEVKESRNTRNAMEMVSPGILAAAKLEEDDTSPDAEIAAARKKLDEVADCLNTVRPGVPETPSPGTPTPSS